MALLCDDCKDFDDSVQCIIIDGYGYMAVCSVCLDKHFIETHCVTEQDIPINFFTFYTENGDEFGDFMTFLKQPLLVGSKFSHNGEFYWYLEKKYVCDVWYNLQKDKSQYRRWKPCHWWIKSKMEKIDVEIESLKKKRKYLEENE